MQQKRTLLALYWPGRLLLLLRQVFDCVLGILLYILGSSQILQILMKILKIMERTLMKFCKTELEAKFPQNFHLVIICAEEIDF